MESMFLLYLGFTLSPIVQGSMHWLVTEDGMVESLSDTHMNMKRPWDLVEWLRQRERVDLVNQIDNRLRESDRLLIKSASKDTNFEVKFMAKNENCQSAGKPLGNFDLYVPIVTNFESKGIDSLMHLNILDFNKIRSDDLQAPVCERFSRLDYSPYAFEHLPGIQGRNEVTVRPEIFLSQIIVPPGFAPNQFGHMVNRALGQNSTSWVLYNLGAFYWRIKGAAARAIECLRRALHFSPRQYADVALVSLANILHIGHRSQDAAVLMHAALQISPNIENYHYLLGNVFAVLGDYEASEQHFQKVVNLRSTHGVRMGHDEETIIQQTNDAEKRLLAVRCLQELTDALETEHIELENTWRKLRKFEQQSESYEQARSRIRKEEADHEMKMDARLHYEQQLLIEQSNLISQICRVIQNNNGLKYFRCSWNTNGKMNQRSRQGSVFLSRHLTSKEDPNKIEMARYKAKLDSLHSMQYLQSIDYSKPLRPPLYYHLNGLRDNLKLNDPSWPDARDCFQADLPAADRYPTVYISPENKGFEVRALLTEAQGLSRMDEHDLPWYPPQCMQISLLDPNERSYDYLDAMKARYNIARPVHLLDKFFDASMTQHIKKLVSNKNARIEDIGQRIFTAMKQKLGPDWVLYNLAGLYWRVQGHIFFGIECMRRALYSVPASYRDIPLVNLANMLYKWGRIDDAFVVMQDALSVNNLEPESHFFYANLLAVKKNFSGAVHHYALSLRQNPDNELAWKLIQSVKCEIKRLRQARGPINEKYRDSGGLPNGVVNTNETQNDSNKRENFQVTEEMRQRREDLVTLVVKLFRKYEMCSDASGNTDCEHLIEHMIGDQSVRETVDLPHIKLVSVKEIHSKHYLDAERREKDNSGNISSERIIHGFLWNVDQHILSVEDDECIVFNDTSRTIGCHVTENLYPVSETVIKFFYECLKVTRPKDYGRSRHSILDQEFSKSSNTFHVNDGTEYIKDQVFLSWPTWDDCIRHKTIDFNTFVSTLLTVQAKGMRVHDSLSKFSPVRTIYPVCKISKVNISIELNININQVFERSNSYSAEIGLKDSFRFLLNRKTDFDRIASCVAMGLQENSSSWVMSNLAGLYWRIRGDTENAFNCLINAYTHSPNSSKDVALIGIANILHKIGMVSDALKVTKEALKLAPNTAVAHFTMANLYAYRKDWHRATLFYESTLGLQGTFKPAVERLRAIQCRQVLSKPVRNPVIAIIGGKENFYHSVEP